MAVLEARAWQRGAVLIQCRPLDKIYYNPDNGYTVAVYETEEELPEEFCTQEGHCRSSFRAVGMDIPLSRGVIVNLDGKWKESNYGMQYEVKKFHINMPTTKEGICSYLSSGLIKGIGPVTAERIVKRFGEKTFDIFEKEPERLLEIQGITEGKLEEILESYQKSNTIKSLMVLLSPMGATPRMVTKIQEHFKDGAVSVVKENPYRLCEIRGFGFKTVDPIAVKSQNFHPEDPLRIKAAIRYILEEAESEGHLFLYSREIVERTGLLLNHKRSKGKVSDQAIRNAGNQMVYLDKELVAGREKNVYPLQNYRAESGAASKLIQLIAEAPRKMNIEPYLDKVQKREGILLDDKQKEAVRMVFQHGVSIITGGPGRGKTTVIRIIIGVQEELDKDAMMLLCAPTGKARRRMYESTGYPALTIHKAVGLSGEDGEEAWNEPAMLPDDLIVADEFSMVDMFLAYRLFSCIRQGTRFVMVGDKDQIPSVGPGNVFKELIASGVIPTTVLDTCFRQAENSTISENADRINGNHARLLQDDSFQIYPAGTDEIAAKKIMEIYEQQWKAAGKNADAVQVLSPLKKDTLAGADALNEALRDIVNPETRQKRQIKNGKRYFRQGDKVMQIKNSDEISNGDIGSVSRIYKEAGKDKMEVDFGDGRLMEYEAGEMWPLTHAYAMSVHKSQGSEYPVVILPMLPCFYRMLKRNIFYTAVTRAKQKVIIVGSQNAIRQAIRSNDTEKRNTVLGERVKAEFQKMCGQKKTA